MWARPEERMARVPTMARGNILFSRGFHCCPNFCIALYIYIYIYIYIHTHTHTQTHTYYIYIYIYIHTYTYLDCIEIAHELPLLPNNAASETHYSNLERCEALTGYLSLGSRPGGDGTNTWRWTKRFTIFFSDRSNSSPSYCHIFFLIAIIEEAFIRR